MIPLLSSNNLASEIAITIAVFIASLVILRVLQWLMLRYLGRLAKKTKTELDDTAVALVKSFKPPFYVFLSFYIAIHYLNLSQFVWKIIDFVLVVWLVYQAIYALQILIDYGLKLTGKKHKDQSTQAAFRLLGRILKWSLWFVGILFVLSNLGVNISSVLAGLGIGGIAVALALQNILGDLFSSFAIFFDKPFEIGDFIIVGDKMGTVERIGIKTTRLRSLGGEELVMPNTALTASQIQNYKRMQERRIVFHIGVTYDTPQEKMKKGVEIIKDAIAKTPQTRLDRVNFATFDDSALTYEAVYYVLTGDYNIYMNVQEAINLNIKEKFEKEGIDFAFPTRTVFVKK